MLNIIVTEERDHQKLLSAWSAATDAFLKQDALLERCDKTNIKGVQRLRNEQAGLIMLRRKFSQQILKNSPRVEIFIGGKVVVVDETEVY